MAYKNKIIDGHINLASDLYIPMKFIVDTASNMYARLKILDPNCPSKESIIKMTVNQYKDHNAERLLDEMNNCGIDQAVLLVPNFTNCAKLEIPFEEAVERHIVIVNNHPDRFHLFVGVDPNQKGSEIDAIKKYLVHDNVKGIKLYPPAGHSPSDERLFPIYEYCAENNLSVFVHNGPGWHSLEFSYGDPLLIDEASRRFSNVNFILGHGGVYNIETCIQLCKYRENVYMDISGFASIKCEEGWQKHLNTLFHRGINHKIIYGTSWPASRMATSMVNIVKEIRDKDSVFNNISVADQELIMFKNMNRVVSLEN